MAIQPPFSKQIGITMKYPTLEKVYDAWLTLQPLSDSDREKLSRRFTIDFNYNSNHIEGNTLTYGQTELLLPCRIWGTR